nr:ankyrin repeat protein [Sicyoidochytrium minutum DNA virus]
MADAVQEPLLKKLIREDNSREVSRYLGERGDPNVDCGHGKNALLYSLSLANGRTQKLNAMNLIAYDADIHAVDDDGKNGFLHAVQSPLKGVCERMIVMGCDVHAVDREGNTSLHLAVRQRRTKIIKTLLSMGVGINIANREGETAFHIACETGQHVVVSDMLEYGADVNIQNSRGYTPMMEAIKAKREKVCSIIRMHGFDTSIRTPGGSTYFDIALKALGGRDVSEFGKDWANIFYLLKYTDMPRTIPRDYHQGDFWTALSENKAVFTKVVKKDVMNDLIDQAGVQPLFRAIETGNDDAMNIILARGFDTSQTDKKGRTVLESYLRWVLFGRWAHDPVAINHRIAAKLLANGATKNTKGEDLRKYREHDEVGWLVDSVLGMDPLETWTTSETPCYMAMARMQEEAVIIASRIVGILDEGSPIPFDIALDILVANFGHRLVIASGICFYGEPPIYEEEVKKRATKLLTDLSEIRRKNHTF